MRQVFNVIFTHLLNKTEHHPDCTVSECSPDCSTQRFLNELEEPFMPWEIEEEERQERRRMQLLRGDVPA